MKPAFSAVKVNIPPSPTRVESVKRNISHFEIDEKYNFVGGKTYREPDPYQCSLYYKVKPGIANKLTYWLSDSETNIKKFYDEKFIETLQLYAGVHKYLKGVTAEYLPDDDL